METWVWVIIAILCVAIAIAALLANRKQWRIDHGTGDDPIEHYTEKRDELSGLEDEDIEEEETSSVSFSNFNPVKLFTSLITFGITIFVFWQIWSAVTPIMNEQMNTTGIDTTTMTMVNTMTGFLPIIAIIGFVFIILSAFGTFGSSSEDDEVDEPPKKKPRKKGVEHYTAARDSMSKVKKK